MSPENKEKEDEKRWLILRTKVFEEKIKTAFGLFRTNGIEPVLIKGWAAAKEYPEKYQRVFSDIDLCVAPQNYEKSLKIIAAEEVKVLNIDLHCGLRHLDTLEWEDLFENSVPEFVDETEIRILRPEDHLRVLCVHWLTDGGAYRERLLDIYYLLENHSKSFDWERCLGKISQGRRDWIIKTIAVVHKYYPFDVSGLPFVGEMDQIPGWFIKTMEREWASETKLLPIHSLLNNRRELWKQIKKRFPPNAITATIDMEGPFDDSRRGFYQVGSIILRLKPSVIRVFNALKLHLRSKNK